MKNPHTKAVFLDRDGVVNKLVVINGERTSPKSLEQFEIIHNLSQVIRKIREQYLVIIVTNQPDIARKNLSVTELEKMHVKLREQIEIDDLYVCEHDDVDNCLCRKPKPGMIINAAKKWKINLKNSIIVGDSWRDMVAGEKVGLTKYYVDHWGEEISHKKIQFKYDHMVKDLKDAAKVIYEKFVMIKTICNYKMKDTILIFGSGSQAKVTIDIIELLNVYEIAGIIDDKGFGMSLGYPMLGTESDLKDINIKKGIIAIGNNWLKISSIQIHNKHNS